MRIIPRVMGLLHDVVQSTIHSTDTHGYNEAIFGTTHLLGFSFAPKIKKFSDQQLYGFLAKNYYEAKKYKILPESRIDLKLIEENWNDILRFVATLKLNYTLRQHPLYKTIKEYGKIIKTIFLLTYIDDLELRKSEMDRLSSENILMFLGSTILPKGP